LQQVFLAALEERDGDEDGQELELDGRVKNVEATASLTPAIDVVRF
jgi:hypothetical protein